MGPLARCNDRTMHKVAAGFATPLAIVAVVIACVIWLAFGLSVDTLTLALSILSITMTQLILLAQDRDTKAIHAKIDELVRASPEADDALCGIERQ